jgi:hypothetical protein
MFLPGFEISEEQTANAFANAKLYLSHSNFVLWYTSINDFIIKQRVPLSTRSLVRIVVVDSYFVYQLSLVFFMMFLSFCLYFHILTLSPCSFAAHFSCPAPNIVCYFILFFGFYISCATHHIIYVCQNRRRMLHAYCITLTSF